MIDVNLGAALWLTQAVVPYMRDRGAGSIVHVASRPGLEPAAGEAAYALSKAALVHLIRILDLELRPSGIRVNGVAPQLLNTAVTRQFAPPDALAHAVTPEAIADLLAYLADAAGPVSGAVVAAYGALPPACGFKANLRRMRTRCIRPGQLLAGPVPGTRTAWWRRRAR